MQRNRILKMSLSTLLLSTLVSSAPTLLCASEPEYYPISVEQIAQTLSESGMQVKPANVSLGMHVVASKLDPDLNMLEVRPATSTRGRKTMWVRIGCKESGVCLPFYATVAWDGDLADLQKELRPASLQTSTAKTDSPPAIHTGTVSPPAMHAGTHATLVIASDRSRIKLSVIALQNGSIGQVIRVASPDHKQIYRAEVLGANLLKGTM
jgi:hypothetical protein